MHLYFGEALVVKIVAMVELGLPDVRGPKLLPFSNNDKQPEVIFIENLGSGYHAYVWKVLIDGKAYALKMVRALLQLFFRSKS